MKRFFSYNNENGMALHDTLDEARDSAEANLDCYRDMASDQGWEESIVESICFGVVIAQTIKTHDVKVEDMSEQEQEDCPCDIGKFDRFVEYDIKSF